MFQPAFFRIPLRECFTFPVAEQVHRDMLDDSEVGGCMIFLHPAVCQRGYFGRNWNGVVLRGLIRWVSCPQAYEHPEMARRQNQEPQNP